MRINTDITIIFLIHVNLPNWKYTYINSIL